MTSISVIACDPGSSGSLCLLKVEPNERPLIRFIDHKHSIRDLANWISIISDEHHIRMAMIEDVHSIHGTSAKSNFQFGKNLGIATALLSTCYFGLDTVSPKVWQKFAKVPPKLKGAALKKEIAAIAERLYPGCPIRGPQGGLLDGRSDALMIAHYCLHKYK